MNKKLLFLLVLLLTAATGAWAQTETLLTTIESTANQTFTNGSKTFDEIATVTFSAEVSNDGDDWGWFSNQESDNQTITVTAASDAYTITRVKFYSANGSAFDEEAPFLAIVRHDGNNYITKVNGTSIGRWGLNKIEVYGYEGAATPTAAGYTVSLKDGVKDAGKWTVKAGTDGSFQSLPLKGVKAGTKVKLKYDGDRSMLKGVTATSDAAAPSVPDGAISGVFSVSSTKKVYFSKGNLRYASGAWSFFDNQYDYYDSYSADAWDKFGWSTSAPRYGMNTSTDNSDYSGDFVDWGATMGTGWFTLSSDEWTYLFNTRTVNGGTGDGKSFTLGQSVNGKLGVVIYPDNYTGEVYSGSDWATFESAGCVFLPAAGSRAGSSVNYPGSRGYYWSASPIGTDEAYRVYFASGSLNPANSSICRGGCSVRLVREVATSDAKPAATAKTITIAADFHTSGNVATAPEITIEYNEGEKWSDVAAHYDWLKMYETYTVYYDADGKSGDLHTADGGVTPSDLVDPTKSYYWGYE